MLKFRRLRFLCGCYRSFRIQKHHSLGRWAAFRKAFFDPYYWVCDISPDGQASELRIAIDFWLRRGWWPQCDYHNHGAVCKRKKCHLGKHRASKTLTGWPTPDQDWKQMENYYV